MNVLSPKSAVMSALNQGWWLLGWSCSCAVALKAAVMLRISRVMRLSTNSGW